MPTLRPRLNVTLTPAVSASLRRLSELTGNSQSATVAELLEASQPVFERMVRVLEAAAMVKAKSEEERAALRSKIVTDLESLQGRLEEQFGLQLDELDARTDDLVSAADRIERRKRGGEGGGAAARCAHPSDPHV